MGKLEGKVVFITGAARGQGRSHAVRLAEEGADVIAVDICAQIESVQYPMSTADDLRQTVKEVEALGRRIFAAEADVRDVAALRRAYDDGVSAIGPADIVLANAGIVVMGGEEDDDRVWDDTIGVNLTGVHNTLRVSVAPMIRRGQGGAIVLTSSTMGLKGSGVTPGSIAYTASKHGIVGLMRSYANLLAPHSIRVNTVHPTAVRTPMVVNAATEEFFQNIGDGGLGNPLPVDMVESIDVSNAIVWLVSDEGRYVTGITLPVDAGFNNKV